MTPIDYCQELERIYVLERQMRDTSLEDSVRSRTADAIAVAIENVREFEEQQMPTLPDETRTRLVTVARDNASKRTH